MNPYRQNNRVEEIPFKRSWIERKLRKVKIELLTFWAGGKLYYLRTHCCNVQYGKLRRKHNLYRSYSCPKCNIHYVYG